ncbi:trans-3-hydroxy-L-proline dehydratase [Jhaorihella thermophila]|uniref:Proline racemase n=1 Tax=Jhaorihella thermophila TaxID=488547 RepID=A0A1H5UFH6_9RHOB|nr:proline racemase family protein [Jhaorihella thermophila]SEF73780.1 Proline racemase [Jhaorihella thermophila]
MRSVRSIHIVSAHAGGEIGDVIVGGVLAPPGETLWEQRDFIARDGALRDLVLNEPRGSLARHVNLLVPPRDPRADAGFIIMEPVDTPPMSGSNTICVATVLLETGLVQMHEPETRLTLEVPGGLVDVRAECRAGRVLSVTFRNLPSFADRLDAALDVPGLGTIRVDTAFGGDSFVFVDAGAVGAEIRPDSAADLVELGMRIVGAANEQIGFVHPTLGGWRHISFCAFVDGIERAGDGWKTRHAVCIRPGRIDRSPTGTALSARIALLAARGRIGADETLVAESIVGSRFQGRMAKRTQLAGKPAVIPEISGRAFLSGVQQILLDPEDPWPRGYRVGDTWPMRPDTETATE